MNEKHKQLILNGAFAATRKGSKVKFVAIDSNIEAYKFIFVDVTTNALKAFYLDKHLESYDDSNNDIVGLWIDKSRAFNLEEALGGHPLVDLHNHEKCWLYKSHNDGKLIIEYESDGDHLELPKLAYIIKETNMNNCYGMWEEPVKEEVKNSKTRKRPPKWPRKGQQYYTIYTINGEYSILSNIWENLPIERKLLVKKHIYRTREEAEQVIKLLKGAY